MWRQLDNLKILPNGDFQLNPEAYYPLTLYNTSVKTVHTIQNLFMNDSGEIIINKLRNLFASDALKIREIDGEGHISEPAIRKDLLRSSPLDRAELFFWIYAAYFYRRQTVARAEEAAMHGAIEGLEYYNRDCLFSDCLSRHGEIYKIEDAKKIKFRPGCTCDLMSYNSGWGKPASQKPNNNESTRAERALIYKRNELKEEFRQYVDKDDLPSLIQLERMYRRSDLKWNWNDLSDFSAKFKKQKDYQRALTWINAAIDSRMHQMRDEVDSCIASLYMTKGLIYSSMKEYSFSLLEFIVALRFYNWTPTKTLSSKINSALKRAGLSEGDFTDAVEKAKKDGLLERLKQLKQLANII